MSNAGGAGVPERIAWAESCGNVRTRVYELLSVPQTDTPHLDRVLRLPNLRFRAASVPEPQRRASALESVRTRVFSPLHPEPRRSP